MDLQRILNILPGTWIGPLKLVKMRFLRAVNPPTFPRTEKIHIHLGCGAQNDPGFINVDLIPYPHVHFLHSVEKLPFFSTNHADLIYASHVLEHISHQRTSDVLKEWARVLKHGGILRLSVPDFNRLLFVYRKEKRDLNSIINPLLGKQNYKYNFHAAVFTEKYLTALLTSAGFTGIKTWSTGNIPGFAFNDWAGLKLSRSSGKHFISLNLEARKV